MGYREKGKGNGFLILYLTPSKAISSLITEPLKVVEVLPDYTLGGFFGALYNTLHEIKDSGPNIYHGASGQGSGSLLEFGIITGLTQCNKKKGLFLSPHPPMIGSGLIWENRGNGIHLCGREGFSPCISLKITPIAPGIPVRFHIPFIETKGEAVVFNIILPVTKTALSFSSIHIPPSSPLSGLPFKSKIFSVIFRLDQVIVEEPKAIKSKVFKELKTGVYGG